MKKFPKPWFRPSRGLWYVTLDGVQHNLGPDEQAAQTQYFQLLAHRPEPGQRPREAVTQSVAVLIDEFLGWCQKHRAPRTYEWYQIRLQSFLKTIPGKLPVMDLKPFHLTKWIDAHPAWNDTTRRSSLIGVLRACNWAVREGYLDKSPLRHIELPQSCRRESVIDEEQYDRILSLCSDRSFRDLLTVAWECGPRPHELLRVEGRHVDLTHGRWVFPVRESKGKRRERVIYLTPAALEITKRRMSRYRKGPLFRNSRGKPWLLNTVDGRFKRLRKRLGMKICLYIFRHSWMTRLMKRGVDPITVSTLAGHVDTSMLARVYTHFSNDMDHLRTALKRGVD